MKFLSGISYFAFSLFSFNAFAQNPVPVKIDNFQTEAPATVPKTAVPVNIQNGVLQSQAPDKNATPPGSAGITHFINNQWTNVQNPPQPKTDCPPVSAPQASVPVLTGSPQCVARYKKLYSKPEIHTTIAFGYWDGHPTTPFVATQWIKADFIYKMTKKCPPPGPREIPETPLDQKVPAPDLKLQSFCGFHRGDDADQFYKDVMGPDGQTHRVVINTISPVEYPPNGVYKTDNELRCDPDQPARSEKTRQAFIKALQEDDVVMYNGHSRNGGGPDFYPPRLLGVPDNPETLKQMCDSKTDLTDKHVDYESYIKRHDGINDMTNALSSSKHHPEVISMMSCDSKLHFGKKLAAAAPDSALLATNMIADPRGTDRAQSIFLDALLSMRCDDDFVNDMEVSLPLVAGDPKSPLKPMVDLNGWGVKTPNVVPAPAQHIPDR